METNATPPAGDAAPQSSVLERRLDLSVAVADLDKDIDQRLRQMGKKLKMPGFRPGKVPFNIVKQHYGHEAYIDALNDALQKAFDEAVKAHEMRVAGSPNIEAKKTEDKERLEFTAVFEVYPEVKVASLADVTIERPTLEIGAAEMESTLNVLRRQRARFEPVERAAVQGDRVVVDFIGKMDGEPFPGNEAKDHSFVLGEGAMQAEFENAVAGLAAGESKTFEMTFPADYHVKDLGGRTATFEVTVKEAAEPVLPEIGAEFAKSLGIADGDVGKMRSEIETNLRREVKNRLKRLVKQQVMDALLKTHPIEVPKALVEMEIDHLMENARGELEQHDHWRRNKDFPMKREWFAGQARRRVGLGLVLSEIVKANALQSRPEQVRSAVEEAAQSYEHPEEIIRWYYAQPERLAEIEGLVIEDNVVDWALANARVSDKAVAFDELMGRRGGSQLSGEGK
jgi:trigger factor